MSTRKCKTALLNNGGLCQHKVTCIVTYRFAESSCLPSIPSAYRTQNIYFRFVQHVFHIASWRGVTNKVVDTGIRRWDVTDAARRCVGALFVLSHPRNYVGQG